MMNKIEKLIKTKTENCNSFFVATHMFGKKKKKKKSLIIFSQGLLYKTN